MRRKPIELAAVATAAVPGLTPTAVSSAADDPADFDSALLLDSEGKRWRVRSPRHAEASARLETEFLVLRAFAPAIRAELPFLMPTVAGSVRLGALSTFVYSHLAGSTRSVEELTAGPAALAREVGSALAAIHDLPHSLVSNADLPSYTPNEFRQRRLNELDQAATTGKIPASLLRRWEHAMEDVSLWRFNPSVVHGDLHEDNLLVDGSRVTAVTGWTDLRIGDPADDFAWLVASNEQDFVDAVLASYTDNRRDAPDQHLLRRAALSAEFALAQYLVKGIAAGDAEMVAEAEGMLATLAADVEEHGGQAISVEPLPGHAPAGAGVTADAEPSPAVTPSPAGSASSASAVTVAPVPAVTVVPVPDEPAQPVAVPPAVEVSPIPADPTPAEAAVADREPAGAAPSDVAQDGAPEDKAPAHPVAEDTSTAAINIVDVRKH
ncbi:phosphotransferase [Pseudarthrobacter sulfonivorans]|uniref:macrolide 2'-phosphotransferase n=1 Tax=Pseudarthrobacter sulfonivorans TaxID=121292 RepID=UPI00285F72AB|nr:phosphotransferase [Pseudarthrobacter sulfonivorans]MDR6413780.1 aminoglycoside phosphotransferase (APT) family kinase protein [Pseudarthrobacter sulfonivorans]